MLRKSIARIAFVAVAAAVPASAAAQLAPADVAEFMGAWTITIEGPQGPIEQELTVKVEDGKVVADLVSSFQQGSQRVAEVAKEGKDLVLKYSGNYEGTPFDARVVVTLAADDKLSVVVDVNGGQFSTGGTGVKKK